MKAGPAENRKLERLRQAYPGWTIGQDGARYTATRNDGNAHVDARSPDVLGVLLHNEMWRPLTGRSKYLPPEGS